ncbi:calcium-binding protein [Ramlibacter sp.]|uniref:calcium-binding protein n=1 Tax=Ramlibacter sp. TaxID=1917967 RepID=UPI002C465C88|nr:calcium-binding protein [Ramlibacter sp.]HWI81867.1 calcium-binding protein [Ramlibacter sp.]
MNSNSHGRSPSRFDAAPSSADERAGPAPAGGHGHHDGGSVVTVALPQVAVYHVGWGMMNTPYPAIAALSDGGYVVAWSVLGKTTVYVYTQEFDAAGTQVGGVTEVSDWGGTPAIAATADGGFVVAWESLGALGQPGHDIMAQRFDNNGAPAGAPIEVNATTAGNQFQPSVTALADGGWLVTWTSYQDGSSNGVYAQRFDGSGAPVGAETRVNTTTADSQEVPAVAALGDGGYVVAWGSYGQDGSGYGIYAQRFDVAGTPVAGETRVNTTTAGDQWNPSVAALADGGYLVTWAAGDIYAQRFDHTGAPVGGEARLTSSTGGHALDPGVAAMSDGGCVVTWQWQSADASDTNVYAQRYDSSGAPVGAEMQIDNPPSSFQSAPAVAALAEGGFAVTWWDSRPGAGGYDVAVYVQRFQDALAGTPANDWLDADPATHLVLGYAGDDHLYGLAGNDSLDGGLGNDFMAGGAGNDTYFVDSARDKVMERHGEGLDTVRSSVSYELGAQVENLVLVGPDAIDGTGNALDNALTGNAAPNVLTGGRGNDTLDGGGGRDVFVFEQKSGAGNVDLLVNFVAADDVIQLDGKVFRGLDAGSLAAAAFQTGASATDPSVRIVYDPATGALTYDRDGSGDGAAVQIATLVGLVGFLSAENFVVT